MLKKRTIFDFFGNVLMIYGISVLILATICHFVGNEASEVSTMFGMDGEGLRTETLFQFLAMVVLLVAYEWLFLSDLLIKNWPLLIRTICMFAAVIFSVGVFAAEFGWFPVNMPRAWIAFLVSFFVCAAVSICVSVLKEKSENKKMQEALDRLQEVED